MTSLFRKILRSWFKASELVFFPSHCRLCGNLLEKPGEKIACGECLSRVAPRMSSYCTSCGRFFEGAGNPHICSACIERRPPFTRHRSCASYQAELKDLILLFKFRGYSVLAGELAGLAEKALGKDESLWSGVDLIVPVPLHRRRKKSRGYNQALLLAERLGRSHGVPVLGGCLIKTRDNPPQTSLESREREINVRGAYAVKAPGGAMGNTILLVDDVYTTGSTLRECSRVLLEAGAKEIRALTIARA